MTQVNRITEDIAHMPVAAFIFRDKENDEVHYSADIRYLPSIITIPKDLIEILGIKCLLLW